MAEDKQARRILLHLLAPASPCWLPPALATIVQPPKRMAAVTAAAPAVDEETEESLQDAAVPAEVGTEAAMCALPSVWCMLTVLVSARLLLGPMPGFLETGISSRECISKADATVFVRMYWLHTQIGGGGGGGGCVCACVRVRVCVRVRACVRARPRARVCVQHGAPAIMPASVKSALGSMEICATSVQPAH